MRIFEILFLLFTFLSSLYFLFGKTKKRLVFLTLISNAFLLITLIFEGYRTHIVPSMILSVVLFIAGVARAILPSYRVHRFWKIVMTVTLIPFLLAALALPALFPVVSLPKPNGSYEIGTFKMSFVDTSRKETFSDTDEYRNIPVQIWYPASNTHGKERAPWIDSVRAINLFSEYRHLPNLFDHLTRVRTNSFIHADLSDKEDTYPVILFSGGGAMFNGQNVVQMEELASHGYIVFAVGHPYEDFACQYPDGTLVPYSQSQAEKSSKDTSNAVNASREIIGDESSPEFHRTILRNAPLSNESARLWAQDMSFILDKLFELNDGSIESPFKNKLDTAGIGAFGHSFGGAASGQLCLGDDRVKAFINMDGSPFGDAPDKEITQPFMILTVGKDAKYNVRSGYSVHEDNFMTVSISGSKHMNFSDINSLIPFVGKLTGFLGTINPERQTLIMNSYILSFFDKYLKNSPAPLFDNPVSPYPEVTLTKQ